MITEKQGDEASPDIERWANEIAKSADGKVNVGVYHDGDSSTYVLRLMKGNRVLVFRLSEAQVRTSGREQECERTLKRKLRDLDNMI
ncbi:MAG: hypothetical protein ACREQ7_08020 [Candidatus Binatia bacterium]